jgi:hypothetical protein
MAQIFHPSANTLSKVTIGAAVLALGVLGWAGAEYFRSDYVTGTNLAPVQPVQFSHKHHVSDAGIDCRYCHTSVETSSFAGIPPTETCMTCHSQIWAQSPMLEPVRASYRTNQSLQWVRVHSLPQFVFFDHSIHVSKGVGCSTCHGRIDQMPLTWRQNTLLMEWCLECHRAPERYVRPRDQIYRMDWTPPREQLALGEKLVREYKIQKLTDCYTCHR